MFDALSRKNINNLVGHIVAYNVKRRIL